LAIVGDFDSKEITEEIKKLTASWKKIDLAKPIPPEVTLPAKFMEKIESMPDAAQLHFYMGHPGIRRNNKDYHKLLVMDYVLGTLPLSLTTNGQVAGEILGIERFNLGYDYLDKYRKEIAAVTPEDVQAVAKKYLDPQRMVLVVAGAVDEKGKPLEKKPEIKEK